MIACSWQTKSSSKSIRGQQGRQAHLREDCSPQGSDEGMKHQERLGGPVRLALLEVAFLLTHRVRYVRETEDRRTACTREGVEGRRFHLDGQNTLAPGCLDGLLRFSKR